MTENVLSDFTMSENINEIATALAQFQGELDSAKKDSKGYGYSYSDLAQVISTAKPHLLKHGLAVVQLVGSTNENVSVTTVLTHKSGQFFKSTATLPVIEMKGCNPAQGAGASLSYLRRYAYQAIIGMASEDNDASSNGYDKPKTSTSFSSENKEVSETKTEKKPRATFRNPKKTSTSGDQDVSL